MVANIVSTSPDPRGYKFKFNFLEYGHGLYQIKGNRECSNMVANILPAAPPPLKRSNSTFADQVVLH